MRIIIIKVISNSSSNKQQRDSEEDSVKPCPAWVERHTSFKSRSEPKTILQRCSAALAQQHADFATNTKKHKIKGVAYVNGSIVHFVCRIYSGDIPQQHDRLNVPTSPSHKNVANKQHDKSSSSKHDYIVEFQKRSGCAMAFNSLYRDIIAQITDIYYSNIDGDSSLPPLTNLSRAISQVDEDSDIDNESAPNSPLTKPSRNRAISTAVSPTSLSSRARKMTLSEEMLDQQAIVEGANESLHKHDHMFGGDDNSAHSRSTTPAGNRKRSIAETGLAPQEGNTNLCVKQLGDHTLCSLLSMALSEDGMSAREAIGALAGLPSKVIVNAIDNQSCSNTGECSNVSMHGLVNALCRALEGGDSQLTRSAAVLLANLSEEPSFSSHLLDSDEIVTSNSTSVVGGLHDHANLINQVFTLLNFPTCFSAKCKEMRDCNFTNRFPALILRDIKRQVAKALANITLVHPKQMLDLIMKASQNSKIDYKDVLQRYAVSPCADSRLNLYVSKAIAQLDINNKKA